MEHLIMVTGGSRSGKSEFAENLYSRDQEVCYIATGMVNLSDAEMTDRIHRHQERRSDIWTTEERYHHIAHYMDNSKIEYFLLDDATNMITNLFFDWVNLQVEDHPKDFDDYVENMTSKDIDIVSGLIMQQWNNIIEINSRRNKTLVVVTNEVGLGIVPANKLSRVLRDIYGDANKLIASCADEVWFVVSGIPKKIK
ncbi:bifunctional adenosylcobinamide kinase/adenosylcobinamide-phosphate guanylyltransferase [Companilactobacillus ginsenosidimutans]|uniref:Adenosylcobinamide kinase n=1 Tax=Companilactobacillus ginsenosidimutans TaxID=1007676 RepID=A0A0H4QD16_9LACO|nr:bifunctional adenosylcobinamide kinase/adenosylcobinamide-phosphate guanylyltransferase [Companilactobacillus ginsenosidimutans]AKP66229.1 adenosylcobinamide kinase [Companilactobacillus ginsenosidimutans]